MLVFKMIKPSSMKKLILFLVLLNLTNEHLLPQTTYKVGDGQTYLSIGAVPWESLVAGDSVKIYWRNIPYKEKFVVNCVGQQDKWITITGIPNALGKLPVIDGMDATTRSELNFWGEERGVIKIGGSNIPADGIPGYIRLENLEIKNGRSGYSFTGRNGITQYSDNAAAIYLEKGENILIKNCILTNCGNGFFASGESKSIVLEGCYLYGNGNISSIYHHNSYTETESITYQFNYFGPLLSGASGNNLKDRSAGTIIRYNWIEGGNRQLDLVDSDKPEIYGLAAYRSTYVYGNILIEPDGAGNRQICHYGGDSGTESYYRKGKLFFFNNTVVSTRNNTTTLLRLSTNNESADCFNNIIYVTAPGENLTLLDSYGVLNIKNNWIKNNYQGSFELQGSINDLGGNISGNLPGFVNMETQDFHLLNTSDCLNKGTSVPLDYPVSNEYVKHQQAKERSISGLIDPGAFEYSLPTYVERFKMSEIIVFPNPAHHNVHIICPENIFKISIIDRSGRECLSRTLFNYISCVDLSNFKNGIYLIKLYTENEVIVKKLVVN